MVLRRLMSWFGRSPAKPVEVPVAEPSPPLLSAELTAFKTILMAMFANNELVRFLHADDRTRTLYNSLPQGAVAPEVLFDAAVRALDRTCMIDAELFRRLVEARPRRQAEIEAIRARVLPAK